MWRAMMAAVVTGWLLPVALVLAQLPGQPLSPRAQRLRAAAEKLRDYEIKNLENKVLPKLRVAFAQVKRGRVEPKSPSPNKTYAYSSRKQKQRAILDCREKLEKATAKLARLRGSCVILPPLNMHNLAIGDVGVISGASFDGYFVVNQVTSPRELLITHKTFRSTGRTFWLSGVDTSKRTDNTVFSPAGFFEVVGTKGYTNTFGTTSTVLELVLVPIPMDVTHLGPYSDKSKAAKR